jgi:hypothetical protein
MTLSERIDLFNHFVVFLARNMKHQPAAYVLLPMGQTGQLLIRPFRGTGWTSQPNLDGITMPLAHMRSSAEATVRPAE